jgi:hypothetical protein
VKTRCPTTASIRWSQFAVMNSTSLPVSGTATKPPSERSPLITRRSQTGQQPDRVDLHAEGPPAVGVGRPALEGIAGYLDIGRIAPL